MVLKWFMSLDLKTYQYAGLCSAFYCSYYSVEDDKYAQNFKIRTSWDKIFFKKNKDKKDDNKHQRHEIQRKWSNMDSSSKGEALTKKLLNFPSLITCKPN